MLEIKGLSKAFGERQVFKPFDLTMMHGERVGVVGKDVLDGFGQRLGGGLWGHGSAECRVPSAE